MSKKQPTLLLADKSRLVIGDTIYCNSGKHTITLIENGGKVGERIQSITHYLSNATLFTTDILKSTLTS